MSRDHRFHEPPWMSRGVAQRCLPSIPHSQPCCVQHCLCESPLPSETPELLVCVFKRKIWRSCRETFSGHGQCRHGRRSRRARSWSLVELVCRGELALEQDVLASALLCGPCTRHRTTRAKARTGASDAVGSRRFSQEVLSDAPGRVTVDVSAPGFVGLRGRRPLSSPRNSRS